MNKLLLACVFLAMAFFTVGVMLYSNIKPLNSVFGYRTRSARRNQDTWDEANNYAGKCLMYAAILMMGVIIFSDFLFNDFIRMLESLGTFIIISIICIFFLTERRMKQVFYRDGKRKPNR